MWKSKSGVHFLGIETVKIIGDHLEKFDSNRFIEDGDIIKLCDALNGNGYWHPENCSIQSLPLEFMEKVQ